MATQTPQPIDASYRPRTQIKRLSALSPVSDILPIIERDGGIILTNLVSSEQLATIESELEQYVESTHFTAKSSLHIIPKETLAIPGLAGKSLTVAAICELPVLEQLRTSILQDKFSVIREDVIEDNVISPLLSISITLHVGYGAPRQRLHRDDDVHGIRHEKFELKKASQFGCLIVSTRTTQENGAAMFIPGSHLWDDDRVPSMDEICFAIASTLILSYQGKADHTHAAEMDPGSALISLASCYHGGGHNSVPGSVRKMHGLFFVRGTMRTEENQFLAIPRNKVLDMSEKMLSLLGYKKPTTVLGIVENEDPASNLKAAFERANS